MDIAEHLEAAYFPEIINEITIYDHVGNEMLTGFPSGEIEMLIDTLTLSIPIKLSDEEYQQISKAQKEGLSYQLFFTLNDGTIYHPFWKRF